MSATTFSFGPAGSWSMFNVGVALYLLENVPFDKERATCYVVSGGALGLTALLYDDPIELVRRSIGACNIMSQLKEYKFRAPFHMKRICREGLNYILPDNAHTRLGDRVYVGLTHFPSFRRSCKRGPFATKEALVDALLVTAYIPGFFCNWGYTNYKSMIDGGFSHHCCPTPETSLVTTVSKYQHSDIYYDEGKFHLELMTANEYMDSMWQGYAAAERKKDIILEKLQVSCKL